MAELQLAKAKCTTVNIGQAPVITITNVVDATNWTLTWEFGSQSGTIAEHSQEKLFDSYVWSEYFYNEIPNATKGVGVLLLDCYSGNEFIGSTATPFTVLVDTNASKPTISLPSVTEANDAVLDLGGDFVRYVSTAYVEIRAQAKNGASVADVYVQNGGQSFHGSSGYIYNMESPRFTVQVTDTRGLVTTISYGVQNFVEYVKPTCYLGNDRPNTDGDMTLSCYGNYFNGTFGGYVQTENTLSVQYRYKAQGGTFSTWRAMSANIGVDDYNASVALSGLDYRATYEFECRAVDLLASATSSSGAVKGTPVFHWSADDFVFEVPVTFKQGVTGATSGVSDEGGDQTITGDQLITGDLRLKGSGNYGNTLYFGDGSYCYLREESDDDLTIKASDLNLNVTNLYLNGGAIKAGSWTPTLTSSSAVSSYSTRSGWYIRVGNVVTVGFNIGASCYSGYNSTALAISGLPFTPATNAFGGGVMFGAYVNAGFCFEAWAATTGGQITPRLQPCNNTSAGNLQIASTAYYPSGANTLTLGGTITYITN